MAHRPGRRCHLIRELDARARLRLDAHGGRWGVHRLRRLGEVRRTHRPAAVDDRVDQLVDEVRLLTCRHLLLVAEVGLEVVHRRVRVVNPLLIVRLRVVDERLEPAKRLIDARVVERDDAERVGVGLRLL